MMEDSPAEAQDVINHLNIKAKEGDNELTHDPPPIIPEKPVLSSNYPKKGLFSDLDDDDVFSYKLCLTLYIRIHMSCSLLLYHHGHFPFTNSCC